MHDNSGERVLNFGIFFLLLSYDLDHLQKRHRLYFFVI